MALSALAAGMGALLSLSVLLAQARPSAAALSAHATALQKRLDPAEFHVVLAAPFVVIGDAPAAVVERRVERSVRWAVQRLRESSFERGPTKVIAIWLLCDENSYERNTLRPGALPLLLPPGAGAAAPLLPRAARRGEGRPDRPRHPEEGAGPGGPGGVPAHLVEVGARAALPVIRGGPVVVSSG